MRKYMYIVGAEFYQSSIFCIIPLTQSPWVPGTLCGAHRVPWDHGTFSDPHLLREAAKKVLLLMAGPLRKK